MAGGAVILVLVVSTSFSVINGDSTQRSSLRSALRRAGFAARAENGPPVGGQLFDTASGFVDTGSGEEGSSVASFPSPPPRAPSPLLPSSPSAAGDDNMHRRSAAIAGALLGLGFLVGWFVLRWWRTSRVRDAGAAELEMLSPGASQ